MSCPHEGRGCESCRQASINSLLGIWHWITSIPVEWRVFILVAAAIAGILWTR